MNATENELVMVIFISIYQYVDRIRSVLRKRIPHKVYFIRSKESFNISDGGQEDFRERIRNEIENELPKWVIKRSEDLSLSYFDFQDALPKLVKIMTEERKRGNEVIVILGGSSIVDSAAIIAATLTKSKILYVKPLKWVHVLTEDKKPYLIQSGAGGIHEVNIPIDIVLPGPPESYILSYLFEKKGSVNTKLSTVIEEIGLNKIGSNLNKTSSGLVKLSKIIRKLRDSGYIETRKISRKFFRISLTPSKGLTVAEILNFLTKSDSGNSS